VKTVISLLLILWGPILIFTARMVGHAMSRHRRYYIGVMTSEDEQEWLDDSQRKFKEWEEQTHFELERNTP
jgi:hypothetical protein